ncbi:hypothetical protein RGU70_13295 [Herbaspirillum sp. RTI4]|uniref:hypothetical protein n=1 Tax=Herbaspirillum sp. RTI4 TaxID=3048640 RepID=UPI002AB592A2|nr:hypothetical protein [Herbaspirillum sp. RTI4]MDY7579292.1 hypothetical protein [Herbaspirillum sp. RTI4]MEA9982791.1 hypothetical protein [Herbaspirillum sp. RTI4]
MSFNANERFGFTENDFLAAIKSHGNSGILRSGTYIPTRQEVETLSVDELDEYLNGWMWESPNELIPRREQIADVQKIIESRSDAEIFSHLIAECRSYVEDD